MPECHGFLPRKKATSVVKIALHHGAEHLPIPRIYPLFPEPALERYTLLSTDRVALEYAPGKDSLATAPVIENLIAAVGIANAKTRHDVSRSRVPVNFFKGAVGVFWWRSNTIFTILVVFRQAFGEIALKPDDLVSRIRTISRSPSPPLDLDTAIQFTQDACNECH